MSSEDKMGAVKKENTIPLEIAIHKEMAYRRKLLSALYLRPRDDSLQHLHHPLQVGLTFVHFKCLSKCPFSFQSTASVQSAQQVASRVPPPTSTPSLSGTKRKEPGSLHCEICRVSCSSVFNLKQHLMGHKHKSKLQELEHSHNKKGREWCEVCKLSCMNEDLLNLHFKGQKHRAEVHKFEMSKEGGGEIPNQRKWCELCQIWCIDLFAFNQHLQGKKHIFQLHSMQKKSKNCIAEENAMA